MLRAISWGLLSIVLATGQIQASLVYDNGPFNGTLNGWNITSGTGFAVSMSFTVGSATTLTDAQVILWTDSGDIPNTLDWSIGTTMLASDIATGFAFLSSNSFYLATNGLGFDVWDSDFTLATALSPGTYWFTLTNATTYFGGNIYWDINNGPSSAWHNQAGDLTNFLFPGTNSSSFQLSSTSTVPEPASLTLVGFGAVGLVAGVIRRRRHHTAAA